MVVTSVLEVVGWPRRLLAGPGDTRADIPTANCVLGAFEQPVLATLGAVVGGITCGMGVADGWAISVGTDTVTDVPVGMLTGIGVCVGAAALPRVQAIVLISMVRHTSSIVRFWFTRNSLGGIFLLRYLSEYSM
jgi:hypothetical protein